jgi:hypothetical protein
VGFEYSRAEEHGALTEEPADDREFNLYRHPDSQGLPIESIEYHGSDIESISQSRKPYRREYDIYSLGVVLVELGIRKTAQSILDQACTSKNYGRHSSKGFRTWLIERVVPQLRVKMGKLYQEATLLCLNGQFDLGNRSLEAAFYVDVVKNIDRCRA